MSLQDLAQMVGQLAARAAEAEEFYFASRLMRVAEDIDRVAKRPQ
jgi:hypothetical protein